MAKTLPAPLWDSPSCACPRKATLSIAILQMPTSPYTNQQDLTPAAIVGNKKQSALKIWRKKRKKKSLN